jgi:3-hydroxybutyrate dehydrogenase
MTNHNLSGKTAVVTGSTSGIGLAVARKLAEAGANIVLNGFGDAAEIEMMRATIESDFGVKALYDGADLSKAESVKALIDNSISSFGSVDILVNNAGVQHTAPVEEFPQEKWELIQSLMLSAPFYAIQAALPKMREKGWGRIINIASVHGLIGSVNKSAYVAAKHGLVGLTKVVALETAETNVTCNAVCPGWVLTPLVQKQIDAIAQRDGISGDEARVKLLSEKQPSKDFTKPEQIGDFAVFLSSDAASQMRGGAYTLDGGWTAQ